MTMPRIDTDNPDFIEAVENVAKAKHVFNTADENWNRNEPSGYIYGQQFDKFWAAKEALQKAYAQLGKITDELLRWGA